MPYTKQLSGNVQSSRAPTVKAAHFLLLAMGLGLVIAGVYTLLWWSTMTEAGTPSRQQAQSGSVESPAPSMPPTDVLLHVRNAQEDLITVIENLEETLPLLRRTGPRIRSAGFNLQARWLESADSYSDAALQSAEDGLEEIEAAMRALIEENSHD